MTDLPEGTPRDVIPPIEDAFVEEEADWPTDLIVLTVRPGVYRRPDGTLVTIVEPDGDV